jgi:polyisoprenyl-teichoic acid--peptidoglycan teichoic acid transferase
VDVAVADVAERHDPHAGHGGRDPGATALKQAISLLLGIRIDYYAMVDMTGFMSAVDLFGGVDMYVADHVHVRLYSPIEGQGWQVYNIRPGNRTLSGAEALAYVRSRTGANDYVRMRRQRCVVAAMVEQVDTVTILRNFPDIVEVIRNTIVTDIPLEILPDMVMLRDVVNMDEVIAVGFTPPTYVDGRSSGGHYKPATARIQETVQMALNDPAAYQQGAGNLQAIDDHCAEQAIPEASPTPVTEQTPTPEPEPTPEPTPEPLQRVAQASRRTVLSQADGAGRVECGGRAMRGCA